MNITSKIEPSKHYRLDGQVGYLLRLASQRHALIFQEHCIEGLTPTQFAALVRLAEIGAVSQNKLGRLVSTDAATIKGVVDRLRDKNLVCSERCTRDRRRTEISLTQEGAALIESLMRAGKTITDETLKPLSTGERKTLVSLLARIT